MLKSSPVADLMPVKLEHKSNPNYLAVHTPTVHIVFVHAVFDSLLKAWFKSISE